MNYFGTELQFGLVKKINQDTSLIYLVIPEVILNFLLQNQNRLNINLDKFSQFKSEVIRYFFNEEVEELRSLACSVLKSLENQKANQIFQEYRNRLKLTEDNISQEDVSEVFHHLIHLCNIVLQGQKLLYVSAGFDDSALIEG
ncbi:hypothetical protein ACQKP0_08995 [Heyndrickxia sp. NPDC080065]|uniref:hypothetical protein n=1 Tax=Heyndrickxia sp. NPDC080065 TaxID=3390568 RepID=UPI003D033214